MNALAEKIKGNMFISIREEDAERVADWAENMERRGWTKGQNLLVIGRTGSGKSVLIRELWPLFKSPVNLFHGPWNKLHEVKAQPMIIDDTDLGLTVRDRKDRKRQEEMVAGLNKCEGPMVVTSFSDLALRGEWLKVTLDKKKDWEMKGMEHD